MNPADPLAQLNPLREPTAIGWWPLAPGWWLLITLALIVCAFAGWRLLARYKRNAYRRQGITALNEVRAQWQTSEDASLCLTEANALLKAVALRAYPQRDIASLTGENWQSFLNTGSGSSAHFELIYLQAQYLALPESSGVADHLNAIAGWIATHKAQQ
ncbi:MAG: DUF4381 domain-containing protein [Halioglobus sp.]